MVGSVLTLSPLAVQLYTRRSCSLCDEFVDALEGGFPRMLEIELRDVDRHADWRQRFGDDVPVLTHADGRLICQHRLDANAVRAALGEGSRPG